MEEKKEKLTTTDGLVQMLYYLSTCMDLMLDRADAELQLKSKGFCHFAREIKKDFSELSKAMKRYCYYSDKIDEDAFNSGDAVNIHESRLEGANEIVRLLLLYYDRAGNDEARANEVIEFLKGMPSSGIFDNEYISKFRMK